jgi:hypothetical protein
MNHRKSPAPTGKTLLQAGLLRSAISAVLRVMHDTHSRIFRGNFLRNLPCAFWTRVINQNDRALRRKETLWNPRHSPAQDGRGPIAGNDNTGCCFQNYFKHASKHF